MREQNQGNDRREKSNETHVEAHGRQPTSTKRKRKRETDRVQSHGNNIRGKTSDHPHYSVISSVCSTVISLREFCLALGLAAVKDVCEINTHHPKERRRLRLQQILIRILDSTIVGIPSSVSAQGLICFSSQERVRRMVFGKVAIDNSLFERQQYLRDLVPRAILNILRQEQQQCISWKCRNILVRGYEFRRHGDDLGTATNSNLVPKYPNTLVNHLLTKPWEELHAYCGDFVLLFLLTRTLMFARIDNGSLVQLTGTPLHVLVEQQGSKRWASSKPTKYLGNPYSHNNRKSRQRPELLLHRSRIFYVRNCPTRPGLPKRHFVRQNRASLTSITSARSIVLKVFGSTKSSRRNLETKDARAEINVNGSPFKKNTATVQDHELCIVASGSKTASGLVVNKKPRSKIQRVPSRLLAVVPIAKEILERHKAIEYQRLLNRHCPCPCSRKNRCKTKDSWTVADLLPFHSSHKCVAAFLSACCQQLIPKRAWGSGNHNKRVFLDAVTSFVHLGRHETMCVRKMCGRFRLSQIEWICLPKINKKTGRKHPAVQIPPHEHQKREDLLEKWCFWIFDKIIIPIIRNTFYVTETQSAPSAVTYYRKPVWWKIEALSLRHLCRLNMCQLKESNGMARANQAGADTRRLLQAPAAPMRFLPKKTSVRPIVNLSAKMRPAAALKKKLLEKSKDKQVNIPCARPSMPAASSLSTTQHHLNLDASLSSVNYKLSDAFHACKCLLEQRPWLKGMGTNGLDGVYRRLQPYLRRHKQRCREAPASSGKPPLKLFFAKVDLASCFDSILPLKLLDILKQLLVVGGSSTWDANTSTNTKNQPAVPSASSEYVIRRYAMTYPDRCRDTARTRFVAAANVLGEEESNFVRFAASQSKEHCSGIQQRRRLSANNDMSEGDQILHQKNLVYSRKPIRNCVFTDHVRLSYIDHAKVFQLIREHLLSNVVQAGSTGHRFMQTVGIPQGSVMSTLLCDVYFGHMERDLVNQGKLPFGQGDLVPELNSSWCLNEMPALPKKRKRATELQSNTTIRKIQPVGVRVVDDMLFVSECEEDIRKFLDTLHSGVNEYNCAVNKDKTQSNFLYSTRSSSLEIKTESSKDVVSGACGTTHSADDASNLSVSKAVSDFVTYCGLCIDTDAVEIRADYSRYAGVNIRSTVTVPPKLAGEDLRRLTRSFLKPRAHALLFDTTVNSLKVAAFNVFEIGILAAMKFHVHVCTMRQQPAQNPKFFFDTILDAARYMWWLVCDRTGYAPSKIHCQYADSTSIKSEVEDHCMYEEIISKPGELCCRCDLNQDQVHWLVVSSFVIVLSRKQSRYQKVLALLRSFRECRRFKILPKDVQHALQLRSVLLGEAQY